MQYKKYKKLQKFVNGQATGEYKKGEYVGMFDNNTGCV